MALPTSRDFDAVDSGPMPHTTVNNIQDSIIGGRHGAISMFVPAVGGATDGTVLTGYNAVELDASQEVYVGLHLPVGVEITDIYAWLLADNTSDSVDVVLNNLVDGNVITELGLTASVAATLERHQLTTGAPHTIALSGAPPSLRNYRLAAGTPGGNTQNIDFYGWEVFYQKTT